jgi:transposase
MPRFELTDEQFARFERIPPGKSPDPAVTTRDNRLFLDAILWIARTGAPRPNLPERVGKHDTAYQRFSHGPSRASRPGSWRRWEATAARPGRTLGVTSRSGGALETGYLGCAYLVRSGRRSRTC